MVRETIFREDIGDRLVVVFGALADEIPNGKLQNLGPDRQLYAKPKDTALLDTAKKILDEPEPFLVTGAWADPKTGCVTQVAKGLNYADREAYVSKHALQMQDWAWDGGQKTQWHEPEGFH